MKRAIAILSLALAAGAAKGQDGLTVNTGHPRIFFDPTRLAAAQAYYAGHPWTPRSPASIGNATSWAAHSLITNTPSECTAAINALKSFTIDMSGFRIQAGAATTSVDNMRWHGETAALVYDWCYAQMSAADARLIRDRWVGSTANASDPPHVPTDLASVNGSSIVTSAQSPFLPNMAGNNMLVYETGVGTNCPTSETRFAISGYIDANTVQVTGNPTNGGNASGCKARISGYVDIVRKNTWGGPTMPYSNYFWGFWRNDILWGIATSGESQFSADLIADAFGARWTNALALMAGLAPYTASSALGGVWNEGSEYGTAVLLYRIMPVIACQRYGRDLLAETNWFREATFFTLYNTTVARTSNQNGGTYFQMFPWGDDQNQNGYPSAMSAINATGYDAGNSGIFTYSDFMLTMAQMYGPVDLGKFARQYVQTLSAVLTPWLAGADAGGSTLSLSSLPLDYYAPGLGALFTKNTWSPSATQVRVKTTTDLGGHANVDSGDWGILRNGIWLSKEFTTYGASGNYSKIAGCSYTAVDGGTTPATTCDGRYGEAHNVVSMGPAAATGCLTTMTYSNASGFASVARLESKADYSYIVTDLTAQYKAAGSVTGARACRDHNPYVGTVVREYLFIKPLETLVIFDRLLSASNYRSGNVNPVVASTDVVKKVLIHSPVAPSIAGNTATWDNQGQRLKGWFFGPATPTLANLYEGAFSGAVASPANLYQQRLEFSNAADVSGGAAAAQSYMVSVLRAGDTTGWQDFSAATLTDNGSSFTLTLNHPTAGNAVWTIQKGATSSGGTFGYATSGAPPIWPLASTVKGPAVSDAGVAWPGIAIAAEPLAAGRQFVAYTAQLSVADGAPPYRWTLSSGQLPKGLTLGENGAISGTPLEPVTAAFEARVTDAQDAAANGRFEITVTGAPSTMFLGALPSSSAVVLRLYKPAGGTLGSAGCSIEKWPEDPADAMTITADAGGAGVRHMVLSGLVSGKTYYLRARCGAEETWARVVTLQASGGTGILRFTGRPRIAGATGMSIDYGWSAESLNQTAAASCGSDGCVATVSAPAGSAVYFRRRWTGAGGATLAAGGVSAALAPGR